MREERSRRRHDIHHQHHINIMDIVVSNSPLRSTEQLHRHGWPGIPYLLPLLKWWSSEIIPSVIALVSPLLITNHQVLNLPTSLPYVFSPCFSTSSSTSSYLFLAWLSSSPSLYLHPASSLSSFILLPSHYIHLA